jgi:serine/threonine protein kinase
MNIRVVDFGFSKAFSRGNPFLETQCGSPAYISPEIIREEPYTAAADAWSAGVLLYALVCGGLPLNGDNLANLLHGILTATPYLPPQLSPQLRSLILALLAKDPRMRLTVRGALEHPWLTQADEHLDPITMAIFRVHDVAELDDTVLAEMRVLGYDVVGLFQEIHAVTINERTAAYKMLRRKRIVGEFERLWKRDMKKAERRNSSEKLPALLNPGKTRAGSQSELIIVAEPVRAARIRKRYEIRFPTPKSG